MLESNMHRSLVFLIVIGLTFFLPAGLIAATYSTTVNFDPGQGYSYNQVWTHTLTGVPGGCNYNSAQIKFRAKVFGWPFPYSPLRILASDSTIFHYPSDAVYSLTTSTHPSPSVFYTRTFSLPSAQFSGLAKNNQINFELYAPFGAVYYLDFSTLEVECSSSTSQVAMPIFTPPQGTYNASQAVVISCSTENATVYYTTNNEEPTASSMQYFQPIDIETTTTLKAKAYKNGWSPSQTTSGFFTINGTSTPASPPANSSSTGIINVLQLLLME